MQPRKDGLNIDKFPNVIMHVRCVGEVFFEFWGLHERHLCIRSNCTTNGKTENGRQYTKQFGTIVIKLSSQKSYNTQNVNKCPLRKGALVVWTHCVFRFRSGRLGGPWRHITQVTGNLGNHICFVDGNYLIVFMFEECC